jgi:hypothetical protein
MLGIGRTSVFKLINGKKIRAHKVLGRTVITVDSIRALIGGDRRDEL